MAQGNPGNDQRHHRRGSGLILSKALQFRCALHNHGEEVNLTVVSLNREDGVEKRCVMAPPAKSS